MADKPEQIDVIYIGQCTLSDHKKGAVVVARATLDENPEADRQAVWKLASFFPHRAGLSVGVIYKAAGNIVDGRVERLSIKSMRGTGGVSRHDAIASFKLDDAARAQEDKIAAVERKLKAAADAMIEVEQLARLLNSIPMDRQVSAERAILTMIRKAAHAQRRKG